MTAADHAWQTTHTAARRARWPRPQEASMTRTWPALNYDQWSSTCDTLHAHTQVLGKLAVALAPPEPQLQHGALRLTTRGWETLPLPAPDGSGALSVTLDLRAHQVVLDHSDGRSQNIALTPNRPVGEVTREVLNAAARLAGRIEIDPTPQEVPWTGRSTRTTSTAPTTPSAWPNTSPPPRKQRSCSPPSAPPTADVARQSTPGRAD
jgi:hypothetical protein